MKRKTLSYKLETFDDLGKPLKKTVCGEGWYINDSEAKQKGVCIMLPMPRKGVHQTVFIPTKNLRAFVKSPPK